MGMEGFLHITLLFLAIGLSQSTRPIINEQRGIQKTRCNKIASPIETITVFIGQLFEFKLSKDQYITDMDGIPDWIDVQNETVVGIPKPQNLGTTDISVQSKNYNRILRVVVVNEQGNPCGENVTTWVETVRHDEFILKNMMRSAEHIKSLGLWADEIDTMRIYPVNFSSSIKVLEPIGQSFFGGTYVVTWKASCDDDLGGSMWDVDVLLDTPGMTKEMYVLRGSFKKTPETSTLHTHPRNSSTALTEETITVNKQHSPTGNAPLPVSTSSQKLRMTLPPRNTTMTINTTKLALSPTTTMATSVMTTTSGLFPKNEKTLPVFKSPFSDKLRTTPPSPNTIKTTARLPQILTAKKSKASASTRYNPTTLSPKTAVVAASSPKTTMTTARLPQILTAKKSKASASTRYNPTTLSPKTAVVAASSPTTTMTTTDSVTGGAATSHWTNAIIVIFLVLI